MFEVKVSTHFSAAHKILGHTGKCQHLHGHNWDVEVVAQTDQLSPIGISIDFSDLKKSLKEIVEPMDHTYLNELPQFNSQDTNPSAENVARFIFLELQRQLKHLAPHAILKKVSVFETNTCSATYSEH